MYIEQMPFNNTFCAGKFLYICLLLCIYFSFFSACNEKRCTNIWKEYTHLNKNMSYINIYFEIKTLWMTHESNGNEHK